MNGGAGISRETQEFVHSPALYFEVAIAQRKAQLDLAVIRVLGGCARFESAIEF